MTLPLAAYLRYVYRLRPRFLARHLALTWGLPLALDALPDVMSRRRLGAALRRRRVAIAATTASSIADAIYAPLAQYAALSVWHAVLSSAEAAVRSRTRRAAYHLLQRQLLDAMLHADLLAARRAADSGAGSRSLLQLARSLYALFDGVPALLISLAGLSVEIKRMGARYREGTLQPLMALPPLAVAVGGAARSLVDRAVKEKPVPEARRKQQVAARRMAIDSAALNGATVAALQAGNLQDEALKRIDWALRDADVSSSEGVRDVFRRIASSVASRGLLEFVLSSWVARYAMRTTGVTFEEYESSTSDIARAALLGRRVMRLSRDIFTLLNDENEILEMPSFADEAAKLGAAPRFETITLPEGLVMRYAASTSGDGSDGEAFVPMPPALDTRGCEPVVFERNHTYGIVGMNGAAKSTLLGIVLKTLIPEQGEPLWNGVGYSSVARIPLRHQVAYCPQRPHLFEGTLASNIRAGTTRDISEEEMIDCAWKAGIFSTPFLLSLEAAARRNGGQDAASGRRSIAEAIVPWQQLPRHALVDFLNQPIEEGGGNVSGGFAQSVALARTFAKSNAPLCIIDEALSAMDAVKRRHVFARLLETVASNRQTLIMVTHDLELVRALETLVVLERGSIAEVGTHSSLMTAGGTYSTLCGAE